MKLSEIINFDGQGWPYGKLTERACELGGPVRFVNVVHWNGYESGYQSGQASMMHFCIFRTLIASADSGRVR